MHKLITRILKTVIASSCLTGVINSYAYNYHIETAFISSSKIDSLHNTEYSASTFSPSLENLFDNQYSLSDTLKKSLNISANAYHYPDHSLELVSFLTRSQLRATIGTNADWDESYFAGQKNFYTNRTAFSFAAAVTEDNTHAGFGIEYLSPVKGLSIKWLSTIDSQQQRFSGIRVQYRFSDAGNLFTQHKSKSYKSDFIERFSCVAKGDLDECYFPATTR